MSQTGNGPISPYRPPVWTLSTSEQLAELWCVEVDLVVDDDGRHALKVTAYDRAEEPIDFPLLRSLFPVGHPSMIPLDCPLPLWLAYSAVSQAVENFLHDSSEFTLG